jgi:protein O-GlcNAc transferase
MPGLMSCFEDLFRLKIQLNNDPIDRMGLASLLSDLGKYEEAANQLREMTAKENQQPLDGFMKEKATSLLFRTQAAVCAWDTFDQDSADLVGSVRQSVASNRLPSVHPYEALMWPGINLQESSDIASMYAMRAMGASFDKVDILPLQSVQERIEARQDNKRDRLEKIKLGYISPDFTGRHPLAFLMQDVFRLHDSSSFDIYIYSPYESDGSPEVEKIKQAAHRWSVLPSSAQDMANTILSDDLDILIDLCGYTGTALIAEVMAKRVAPIQIGYMGFPASSGAPFIDFMICDEIVVPPTDFSIRKHYSENLIYMPHCYFVNSHKYLSPNKDSNQLSRATHGLPEEGFIFCCHSRPDKIDPITFRSWLRVLKSVRQAGTQKNLSKQANAVLWLLRSGDEMEYNLRFLAWEEFGLDYNALIFAEKAPRDDHLRRLKLADLFLDTPAYNAHTVGVDCLSAHVPMVSLLRDEPLQANLEGGIETEKLASRVGASLLKSIGMDDLIAATMKEYEEIMTRCATDFEWFSQTKERLKSSREHSPLFDTERWVSNLESALYEITSSSNQAKKRYDVVVIDR